MKESISPYFKINGVQQTPDSLLKLIDSYLISKEAYLKDIGVFLSKWLSNTKTVEVNTSGSTGVPKTISLLKAHMINSAKATGDFFSVKENTKALLCLSANYIAGKMMLVRAMVLGWNIYLVNPAGNLLEGDTEHYDFCAMVPLQVEKILSKLNQIKQLIIGGATVSNSLYQQLQQLETQCYATYGMTETITHIAVQKLNHSVEKQFQILPNVSISQDKRKCLVIKAPLVCSEEVITNDIVKITSPTTFQWLGRYDNVVNSGGIKLFPEQIENKLETIIEQRFFVIGKPNERLGQELVLIIEGEENALLIQKVNDLELLSKYEKPKAIHFVNSFVETPTGKIKREDTSDSIS
ncbi:MAG: AMP-binding protein [Flavobacteriaceae bacterium]|nr:AMP-binding protein [Flavobacteriaceae bacterium]